MKNKSKWSMDVICAVEQIEKALGPLALVVWARLPDVLRWAVIQMVVDRVMTAEEIAYQIEMMGCTIEEFDEGVMIEIKWRSKS